MTCQIDSMETENNYVILRRRVTILTLSEVNSRGPCDDVDNEWTYYEPFDNLWCCSSTPEFFRSMIVVTEL